MALQMLTQLGAQGLPCAGTLWRRIIDEALGGLQTSLAQPIAIATARPRAVLVITAIQGIAHFRLKAFLDD